MLLTLLGEFVHPANQPVWTATLLDAFAAAGIGEKSARQAIARAAAAGWIDNARDGRRASWRITAAGTRLIAEGSARLRSIRESRELTASSEPNRLKRSTQSKPPKDATSAWPGEWIVLHISLPEDRRADRLRLYRALSWLGFGNPTPGLWLCPHAGRADAGESAIKRLGLDAHTLAFTARALQFGQSARALALQSWDLPALALHYKTLVKRFSALRPRGDAAVFAAHIGLVNQLQRLPSIDPGLPALLLPAGWPGTAAASRLNALRAKWRASAHAHWAELARRHA